MSSERVEELLQLLESSLNSGEVFRRIQSSNNRQQPFRKAFGSMSPGYKVLDATCGFAMDALCIASWGAELTCFERDPTLFQALNTFWPQLIRSHKIIATAAERVTLLESDSLKATKISNYQCIYMDPIYPDKTGSALGKKKFRILKEVVGPDKDEGELLQSFLDKGAKRIVLKRPPKAPLLLGLKPAMTCKGSSTRYDVFLQQASLKSTEET